MEVYRIVSTMNTSGYDDICSIGNADLSCLFSGRSSLQPHEYGIFPKHRLASVYLPRMTRRLCYTSDIVKPIV